MPANSRKWNGRREREHGPRAMGGREPSRRARILFRWKAPRPFRKRFPSRGGVQRGSSAGCRSVGSLQPHRSGQSVTRVLERSNEEGSPLRRALCSGLSAHAVFAALTRQAQLVRFIRRRARPPHGGASRRRGWPRIRVARCRLFGWPHDTATRNGSKRPSSRARTNRTYGVTARRKCVAEVGGRRCGSEKRRRSVPLTRRSGVCVAGGLARRSIVHGETCGESSASETMSRVGSRRQSREIGQRRRQPWGRNHLSMEGISGCGHRVIFTDARWMQSWRPWWRPMRA